jgi:hypothetical protein
LLFFNRHNLAQAMIEVDYVVTNFEVHRFPALG